MTKTTKITRTAAEEKNAAIPKVARELLFYEWHGLTAEGCESIGAARAANPSYYQHRPGDRVRVFSYAEVAALAPTGALGVVKEHKSGQVSVNEHAQHSLDVFLTETTAAWERHKDRVRRLA